MIPTLTSVDKKKSPYSILALAALGIVFGDIGTSPLYTLKTVITLAGGKPTPDIALGLLSLLIWTLFITVSLKYVTFVMRADNNGEGGIMALMSMLRQHKHHRPVIIGLGLFGAALIYGDGAITPAISVLSAVEGMKVSAPTLTPYVLPLSVFILFVLFTLQFQGTSRIGWIFGPVMALWFLSIGLLGLWGIATSDGPLGFKPLLWFSVFACPWGERLSCPRWRFYYLYRGGSSVC